MTTFWTKIFFLLKYQCCVIYQLMLLILVEYVYDAPILLLTAKEVCKKTLSTASSPTAVGYLHYSLFFSKNSKLTAFKQLSFLDEKKRLSFSSVVVSVRVTRRRI